MQMGEARGGIGPPFRLASSVWRPLTNRDELLPIAIPVEISSFCSKLKRIIGEIRGDIWSIVLEVRV